MKRVAIAILLATSLFYLLGVSSCDRNTWAAGTSLALSSWDLYLADNHITWAGLAQYDNDSKSLVSGIQAGSASEIQTAAEKVAQDLAGYKANQTETQLIATVIVAVNDALDIFDIASVTTGQADIAVTARRTAAKEAAHPASSPVKVSAKESHQAFVAQWNAQKVKPAVK